MKRILSAAPYVLALSLLAVPAMADITIEDAYARASTPRAGAAFMVITNTGPEADRLIEARSDMAMRVELHSHEISDDGVARMRKLEDGLVIAANDSRALKRGGDHVMFMGLAGPWAQGDVLPVTLVFEQAGEVEIDIPVDLDR